MNYIGGIMKINKNAALLIFLFMIVIILVSFSYEAKEGAVYGIALAEKIIIPSLLPLLIIFNLIQNSGAGRVFEKILSPFTVHILRLPECAGPAVFFGLMGGFPAGAILTEGLYTNQDIDESTAKRLMRFNFNGGPAFIITAVGTGLLQSKRAGIILFASTTISSIIIALASACFSEKAERGYISYVTAPIDEALSKSVEQAIKSVFGISAYIILFSALHGIFSIPELLSPLIEITSGIANNYSDFSIPQLAFFLAFGGLCIHLQIFSMIKRVKMKYFDFLLWRLTGAVLACAVSKVLLMIFPVEEAVFSNFSESIIRLTSVNAALSALMIIGCVVFILDIENRRAKC